MSLSSWKARAHPHPSPATYTPSLAAITLLAQRDTQVSQDALTLVVFEDKVTITASGEVFVLSSGDYDAIIALAQRVKDLPDTGSFRNTWRVKHAITSRPIDRVVIGAPGSDSWKQVSVYGYDKEKKELAEPVGDITQLPGELSEILEVVLEGREGYDKEAVNENVVEKVKSILPEGF